MENMIKQVCDVLDKYSGTFIRNSNDKLLSHNEAYNYLKKCELELFTAEINFVSTTPTIEAAKKGNVAEANQLINTAFKRAVTKDISLMIREKIGELTHNIVMTPPAPNARSGLVGAIFRYFGKRTEEERAINQKVRELQSEISAYRNSIMSISVMDGLRLSSPDNSTEAKISQVGKMLGKHTDGEPWRENFKETATVIDALMDLKTKFAPPVAPVVKAKPEKINDRSLDQRFSFANLHRHYTEFYEKMDVKPDTKQINRMAAVLSSPDLRELLGLRAILYNPLTFRNKLEKATSEPGFRNTYFQCKLSEAIQSGLGSLPTLAIDKKPEIAAVAMKR